MAEKAASSLGEKPVAEHGTLGEGGLLPEVGLVGAYLHHSTLYWCYNHSAATVLYVHAC
jgi:hypothetical protein